MNHDLLISLRKYRPREGHDPLENFITEAFCWILKSYDDFSLFFIDHLFEKMNVEKKDIENHEWSTQANFGGLSPDMLCKFGDNAALVFENKAWARLHHNQISNYRVYANENYNESYIILITATVRQHDQNPDLALCWSDVYKIIQEWLKKENNGNDFIFNDFLELIKSEGMAPPAPISHESICSYFPGMELKPQTKNLRNRVKNSDWSKVELPSNQCLAECDQWGRIGLDLLKGAGWKPGVFIGFLFDGWDHCTTPVLGNKSPDFCVIISFDKFLHNTYSKSETYKAFVNLISKQIQELNQDWDFYHHIEDKDARAINKWHPIHIRKPMLELFKGTLTSEEQDARFMESAEQILNIIFKSDEFEKLNKECIELSKIQ